MAIGKSSIKRAAENTKTGTAAAPAVKKESRVTKKAAVKKSVVTGTDEKVMAAVSQSDGINAHYGINTPLPTFLL